MTTVYEERFRPVSAPRPGGPSETVDTNGVRKATCDIRPAARIFELRLVWLKNAKRIRKSRRKITWDNDLRRKTRKTAPADFGGVLMGGG